MTLTDDKYSYQIHWSDEDEEYLGLCLEFPSLSWLASTHEEALKGIKKVVANVVQDMISSNEPIPAVNGFPCEKENLTPSISTHY